MAYIYGSAQLSTESVEVENDHTSHRWKDITGDQADIVVSELVWTANGLRWIDGEILSYITDLKIQPTTCTATGKADNLYFVPKIFIEGIFKVQPIYLNAIFKIGAGNVSVPSSSFTVPTAAEQTPMEKQQAYYDSLHRGNGYAPDPNSWKQHILDEVLEDGGNPYVVE